MKSIINKFLIGASAVALAGFTSCTGDLDQLPQDPNQVNVSDFAKDPKGYLGGAMAKCYSGLAVASQKGQSGACDISGVDGGMSQWSRAIFYLEDMSTDLCLWIWPDEGVPELVYNTWDSNNKYAYSAFSRFYSHIAVCNDFLRLARNAGDYGISLDAEMQKELKQFTLEARALRGITYYYVIDLFGRSTVAWDDLPYGETPPQAESRAALYEKVVADLEEVEREFPEGEPVMGRIGKDAVQALLCKFYLNAEVYTGTPAYDKCWAMADKIIKKHQGGGFQGSGLAMDYLSLFCASNDMFMPGGSNKAQNEILWGIPYSDPYTLSWGGSLLQICAPLFKGADVDLNKLDDATTGYCNMAWYGINDAWGCMLAREEFSNKFGFVDGKSVDGRAYLWLTEDMGFNKSNGELKGTTPAKAGYPPIKYTNLICNADGTMPKWTDPEKGFPRAGVQPVVSSSVVPDTDIPLLRLADVYLMAAECSLRGAAGSSTSLGLQYANYVRERAGVTAWNMSDFTLDNILDERARELYSEGTRRTDLIRFNRYISGYTWSWKGGLKNGQDLRPNMTVYPFPTNIKAVYGDNLVQNPGY